MVSKKKLATAAVGTFGAALMTVNTAPELQADIVPLTFSPDTIATSSILTVFANEVGVSFRAWNTASAPGITTFSNAFTGGLGLVQYSQTLNASTFGASSGINYLGSGENFLGFRHNGNVGWFEVNVDLGGVLTIGPGEYGSAGESVHVGGTVIPEPASAVALAGLALGAAGIRRRRK